MPLKDEIVHIAKEAKGASRILAALGARKKNRALKAMASAILRKKHAILSANAKDITGGLRKGLSSAMIDRLRLDESRLKSMARGLRDVALLKDEIGVITEMRKRPNGLLIGKMRVPIGVIAIIYEARPNVTCDCAALTLKSGNSVILKGGSEAINSNRAIFKVLRDSAKSAGIPAGAINFIDSLDRNAVRILLKQVGLVDLVIPRGGEGLIKMVAENSRVPVIKHYKGVCHVYVDSHADLNMAQRIVLNAKVQRPGVCNAMETLLVHKSVARRFLPVIIEELMKKGVEVRGCPATRRAVRGVKPAVGSDWPAEYLDLILSVKVVAGVDEAIGHIARYGSMHSDTIVTDNYKNAINFLRKVDSACVYLNASTRFTDGGQFGMGAEIGISTDKLHARGPMGLRELTSYKYVIFGDGQTRR